ncbi:hypothetical protein [Desulfovibrio sp. TomC]|uniref:hypothetical protein n=1 Tax=Desulfovibrio sp. TomC TaxID=1562888 RepID=UPI000573B510|nr:hypothetical protein [Desulfovibrio sp. TomC]KHK03739.1 hypothetical protein NY78_0795 [Desulfovibrio sp. TomC]
MSRPFDAAPALSRKFLASGDRRETVIARDLYRTGSLRDDFDRLASPAVPMADADILSFLLKYFHACLFPGSQDHAVPLGEISDLLAQFYELWVGDKSDQVLPLAGEYSAYPLRMLADLPRTAHIFRSVANRPLPPAMVQDPFLGLDLGTGSGIILAAAWFQAKRNGVAVTQLFGVELDSQIGERTGALFTSLGLGEMRIGDARDPALYAGLPDGPIAFVGNENVPAPTSRYTAEPFSTIHAALFAAMSQRLKKTIFFPEALVVRDRDAELDVVLSKNNRFQVPRHYQSLRPKPRSIVIEGRLTKLWQVGKDFRGHIPESWLSVMPGRW